MKQKQKIIFTVDDNDSNLTVCKQILKPYYSVYPIPSAAKMFALLEHVKPDIILLDVEMPEMNGYEAAKILKSNNATKDIPIIFLTAKIDVLSETEGLSLGALDYIHKPFVSTLLLRRIGIYLSMEDNRSLFGEEGELHQWLNNKIRRPLNEITELINDAIGTKDSDKTGQFLSKALVSSMDLLSSIDEIIDMSN